MLKSKPMKIITTVDEMIKFRDATTNSVGFVPTMGALHEGHGQLLKISSSENSTTVLSIFVNPTQFNNADDLTHYPRTWDSDLELAQQNGCDVVFFPSYDEVYPDKFNYYIDEKKLSSHLCGTARPGHFKGVLTVVMKLLQIIQPSNAYFGEKDYQQFQLIQKMAEAFFLRTQIKPVPTVREKDGLAMSSRNLRLTPEQRVMAPKLFKIISEISNKEEATHKLDQAGFKVDYLEDVEGRRYVAAFLGEVRLIDNIHLK